MVNETKPSDQQFEIFLGHLLRTGVLLAALIAFVGGVWFLAQSTGVRKDYRTFQGVPADLSYVPQILHGAITWQPLAVIQLGILVLIATPVARVLFSLLGFAFERDWMYVTVTLVVLTLLLYSLISSSAR
jgi:uncharacterized membrane protein